MIETVEITKKRERYVALRIAAMKQEQDDHKKKQDLAKEQVLTFLERSKIDLHIRELLRHKQVKYRTSKLLPGQIPMDGIAIDGQTPALIIDHQGSPGFSKRIEIAGLRYAFYLGLDEIVITIVFCQSKDCSIFPSYHVTHEDGRFHRIDSSGSFVAQSGVAGAHAWLSAWVDQYIPA